MIDLHLAIPNNNKRDLLRKTLAALPAAATKFGVTATVVDNASVDGSADMVVAEFPDVALIRRTDQFGPPANFNAGILQGPSARYLGVIHEDAEPRPNAFDQLIEFLDSHPRAGGLSPRIRFPDGELDATAGVFPTVANETLGKLRPFARFVTKPNYPETKDTPFRVDFNSATCLIFRRDALEQIGLFDESFVMFYEEVDLSRRLADQGWETWFVPNAEVIHAGGITRQREAVSAEVEARYRAMANHFPRSKYLYFRKHRSLAVEFELRLIDVSLALLRLLVQYPMACRQGRQQAARVSSAQAYVLRNALLNWPRLDPAGPRRLPTSLSA